MSIENKTIKSEPIDKQFAHYKKEYIKNNTVESMVYENGAAIGLMYRETQKLINEVQQLKNMLHGNDNKN